MKARIAWPPVRRQRIAGSPSIVVHSNVARPSGPENDHVSSQMPGAPSTARTRSRVGQRNSERLERGPTAAFGLEEAEEAVGGCRVGEPHESLCP